jgi:hypothetical protein
MKRLVVSLAVGAVALAAAPAAFSGMPTITRNPASFSFEDDTDCGFPVFVQGTGTDINISSTGADGTTRSFDAFTNARATITNLDTGKSVTVSDAGSGHATFNVDGSGTIISTGPALFIGFAPLPGINWVVGRWVGSLDSSGNLTIHIVGGTVRDLCAAVAP